VSPNSGRPEQALAFKTDQAPKRRRGYQPYEHLGIGHFVSVAIGVPSGIYDPKICFLNYSPRIKSPYDAIFSKHARGRSALQPTRMQRGKIQRMVAPMKPAICQIAWWWPLMKG
jgi:hypothetical protein